MIPSALDQIIIMFFMSPAQTNNSAPAASQAIWGELIMTSMWALAKQRQTCRRVDVPADQLAIVVEL
jgi:hypothetical protein